jgi:hypothetical protein
MDPATVAIIQDMILDLTEGGNVGILMVTHDSTEATRLSNRVYVLSPRPARVLRQLRGGRTFSSKGENLHGQWLDVSCEGQDCCETRITGEYNFTGREAMILSELIDALELENVTPELENDIEISGFHMSDIMSEALARASAGNLWITLQNHEAVIALARLRLIPAILLVGNRQPLHGMIRRAKEQGIVVLRTPLPGFEVAGRIYRYVMSNEESANRVTG